MKKVVLVEWKTSYMLGGVENFCSYRVESTTVKGENGEVVATFDVTADGIVQAGEARTLATARAALIGLHGHGKVTVVE